MKDFRKLALMLTFLENAISQKRFLFLIRSSQISISLENLLLNAELFSKGDTKRLSYAKSERRFVRKYNRSREL